MKRTTLALIVLTAFGATAALAQQAQPAGPKEPSVFVYTDHGVQAAMPALAPSDARVNMVVNGTEFLMDGKALKGAPYSAEAVTETVQTLADGNRIVHNSSSKIYRDSEGRTRRELGPGAQNMSMTWATTAANVATVAHAKPEVFISDPVAGVNYSLDTEAKTARKMAVRLLQWTPALADKKAVETAIVANKAAEGQWTTFSSSGSGIVSSGGALVAKKLSPGEETAESLGTQTIEGVPAEGKRVTTTIPAGKIGNELPIVITNETWYSPKLQTIVLSKRHDPRFGDTTFKLVNISQDEPPATLFQVPSDYTVVDTKSLVEQKLKQLQPAQKYY